MMGTKKRGKGGSKTEASHRWDLSSRVPAGAESQLERSASKFERSIFAMSYDDVTDADRIQIANSFLLAAPPGEFMEVVTGAALLSTALLSSLPFCRILSEVGGFLFAFENRGYEHDRRAGSRLPSLGL